MIDSDYTFRERSFSKHCKPKIKPGGILAHKYNIDDYFQEFPHNYLIAILYNKSAVRSNQIRNNIMPLSFV